MTGIRVEWVRYGRHASESLRAAVAAAKADEPLAPVTVVVPSNHVGVASRRLLASGALGPVCGRGVGLAAVTFVTPYRLAELLGAARLAGAGRRPVSTPVIAAAVRAVLAARQGLFTPVAEHPATESALVDAYRELRDVSDGALDALAAAGARAGEVVRIHRAVRARLESAWYDEQDLMVAAGATVRAGGGPIAQLGEMVIHLPQRLSLHSADLLRTISMGTGVTVLAGTTGDERADADVRHSLDRLASPRADLPTGEPLRSVGADKTRFVTTSDADEEVRAAVRAVIDAVRSGVPLDRIAILHASPEPYARLAHEHLSGAGVKVNGAAIMPLTARVSGRFLLQLFSLPGTGFRRQDVLAWLAGAPVLHADGPIPTSAWERLSREAGVVAGRTQWDERLATLASELELRAQSIETDPDRSNWQAERARSDAARATALRRFVLHVIDDLADAGGHPRRWGAHAVWALEQLRSHLGHPGRRSAWPPAEQAAAERVERAIGRLGALDAVEGPVALDVFTRTLELELDSDLGRVGRFGDGVLVGSVGMGVGLDLDLVVVLGLAEGSFPATIRNDSLLPDQERARARGELSLHRERVERQHRELLAGMAGAGRHLLCVPRGDLRRSRALVPSRWAVESASALAGRRLWPRDLLSLEAAWIEHVASFDAGLRQADFPATDQQHRLRSLQADTSGRLTIDVLRSLGDPVVTSGAEATDGRRSDRFTRFDGNLAGRPIPSPVLGSTSATALERWANCPFHYFLHDLLRVEAVENPEDELQITPIDQGSLVHTVLERFILEVLTRPRAEQPAPDEAWTLTDHDRLDALTEVVCREYEGHGLTGRPLFWRRDKARIVADLHRVLVADDARRAATRTRPIASELAFGTRGASLAAVPLALPDGRTVSFRGKADRVDRAEDDTLHVVDYKTGKADRFKALCEEDPDLRGTKLQLAVYGAAARTHEGTPETPVQAGYWFVSSKGRFEHIGYPVNDAVLALVGASLGIIVAGIEAGAFPSHPTATSTAIWVDCHSCDPDGLGVADLHRQWEQKRADPALALYADLAEPIDDTSVEIGAGSDA